VEIRETTSAQDFKKMALNAVIPALLVLLISAVFFFDKEFGLELSRFGLKPRDAKGFFGIFTMPFIHGSFEHLFNNMTALFVLTWCLFYFYHDLAIKILLWTFLMSGIWVWVSARANIHIGASAIVYGLVTFLFFSGIFRMYYRLIAVSMLITFLYGSLVWGILPLQPSVSWEGHFWGSMAGLILAVVFRKKGPQKPVHEWEEETDDDTDDPQGLKAPENVNKTRPVVVRYTLKEKK